MDDKTRVGSCLNKICFLGRFRLSFAMWLFAGMANFRAPCLAQTTVGQFSQKEKEILENLGSFDPRKQREALRSLGNKELENPKIIRILFAMSADQTTQVSRNLDVVNEAKKTLAKLNLESPIVKNEITEILTKWDASATIAAVETLKSGGSAFRNILNEIHSLALKKETNENIRRNSARVLDSAGTAADGLVKDLLQKALSGKSPKEEQKRAVEMLAQMQSRLKNEIVPRFARSVKVGNKKEKLIALEGLQSLGQSSAVALPEILKILKTENDSEILAETLNTFHKMGNQAKDAVPELIKMLGSDDEELMKRGALALSGLGKQAKPVADELIQSLSSENTAERFRALHLLGYMGELAKPGLDKILSILLKTQKSYELISYDLISYEQNLAAKALGNLGIHAKSVVPKLVSALKNQRLPAAFALGEMGVNADSAVADLKSALKAKDREFRAYVARALGQMGENAKSAIPDLVAVLKADNSYVFEQAAIALGKFGNSASPIVSDLTADLKNENAEIRLKAIVALGLIGVPAAGAVPELKLALEDTNPEFRAPAAEALANLGEQGIAALTEFVVKARSKGPSKLADYAEELIHKKLSETPLAEIPLIPKSNQITTSPGTVCEKLCKLVDTTRAQAFGVKIYDYFIGAGEVLHSADAAYLNLDALFVNKASAICKSKENKEFLELQLKKYLSEPSEEQKILNKKIDREDFSMMKIYKDQFDLLIVKDLLSRRSELGLSESQTSRLGQMQKNLGESLSETFGIYEGIGGGSAMNLYAQACSGIAGCGSPELLKNPKYQKATQELIDLSAVNPTSLPYSSGKDISGQPLPKRPAKGSAARAVPVNLLVYLMKPKDEDAQDHLVSALENYDRNKEVLVQHTLFYYGAHNYKQEAVAPYYFYSTIPYAMSALKILKESPTTTSQNLAKVKEIEANLKTLLVRLIDNEKNAFQPHQILQSEKTHYAASPRYANALGGLALLAAYGDECRAHFKLPPPPKEAPLLGILSGVDLNGIEAYLKTIEGGKSGKSTSRGPLTKNH